MKRTALFLTLALHKPSGFSCKMKALILVTFLFFSLLPKAQTALPIQWIEQFGEVDEEYAFGIAVDDSSNTFVTGLIGQGDSSFNQKAQCVNHEIFVARYNSQGNAQWLTKVGALGTDIGWGIAIDKNHDIYTVSSFQDELYLNNDTLTCNGFIDILIMKYNAQGGLLWAKSAGGTLGDEGYGIATDSEDNVYITGSFIGTAQFDTLLITSKGLGDVFLAKYDRSGNLLWAINAGGSASSEDAGHSIAIDTADHVYVAGKFGGTAVFSTDTLVSRGSSDIFIARYDTSGVQQWIRQAGGAGMDLGQSIRTDSKGSLLVTGYFSQSAIFTSDTLISKGNSDIFISKYDPQGAALWTKAAGGSGQDEGASITSASDKKIYVAGYFADTATFGTYVLNSLGFYDAFLLCLDSSGNFEWIKPGGGPGMDAASAVCADSANAVYIAGIFDYTCAFDSLSVNSTYDQNFFLARFSAENTFTIHENPDGKGNLLIFPNPSDGQVTLLPAENMLAPVLPIKITNIMGELVFEQELSGTQDNYKVDLNVLKKGIYFLRTNVGGNMLCKKIIIR